MKSHLLTSVLVLTACQSLYALELSYTPRLSLGVQTGVGLSDDGLQNAIDSLGYDSGKETIDGAGLLEIAIAIAFNREGKSIYGIISPALSFSGNSTKYEFQLAGFPDDVVEQDITTAGVRVYAGFGFGNTTWHGEVLPFIGLHNVGIDFSDSSGGDSESYTAVSYGITLGGYWTNAKGPQIGLRVGFTGMSFDDDEGFGYDANGALFTIDAGWRL